jgi:hypothetical protein
MLSAIVGNIQYGGCENVLVALLHHLLRHFTCGFTSLGMSGIGSSQTIPTGQWRVNSGLQECGLDI